MVEIVEIDGFPGYGVSRDGRAWSRWVKGSKFGRMREDWKEIRLSPSTHGYARICMRRDGKSYFHHLHRIVLLTFGGPPPTPEHQARHLDGDKTNNNTDNLEWGTRQENEQDKKLHGTYQYGENNSQSRLTESDVFEIRMRADTGESYTSIAGDYGVCRHTVGDIVNMRSWSHV